MSVKLYATYSDAQEAYFVGEFPSLKTASAVICSFEDLELWPSGFEAIAVDQDVELVWTGVWENFGNTETFITSKQVVPFYEWILRSVLTCPECNDDKENCTCDNESYDE